MQTQQAYLTPDQVLREKVLPIGRSVLYREIKAGTIPHRRLGKKILISRSAIERWMDDKPSERAA